jgi:hypothetical protein
MANELQAFFDTLAAVEGQRNVTGNRQYRKRIDETAAAGYFDAALKNKQTSQDLALRQRVADANIDYQKGSLDVARQTAATAAANSEWQKDTYNKSLNSQNLWQGIGAGSSLLGLGVGALYKNQENERMKMLMNKMFPETKDATLTPEQPALSTDWDSRGYRTEASETDTYDWNFNKTETPWTYGDTDLKSQLYSEGTTDYQYTPVYKFDLESFSWMSDT